MVKYRRLDALPTYGPMPEQFSATGQGTHSEGLAVEIGSSRGAWVGNFQPGLREYEDVRSHPDQRRILVISGGQGYIVDPETKLVELCGGAITGVIAFERLIILNHQDIRFEALGPNGREWRSPRISYDGFRQLQVEGAVLSGLAWCPGEPEWVPFQLDLRTGKLEGGSYLE